MVSDTFPEMAYSAAEDGAWHRYVIRALKRFAAFSGPAELEPESEKLNGYRYGVRKTGQLDRLVTFTLSAASTRDG